MFKSDLVLREILFVHSNKRIYSRECNTTSLWKAVRIAKDLNTDDLPNRMYENNQVIEPPLLPDQFAAFFNLKIDHIANMLPVKDGVYNGIRKIKCKRIFL